MIDWSKVFAEALSYRAFLDTFATPAQQAALGRDARAVRPRRRSRRSCWASFTRRMPVICLAGAWCGDCINQCPVFDHFARASSAIDLRFLDRDALPEVREALMINGGQRVPVVVFLSEDWHEVVPLRRTDPVDLPQARRRPARPLLPDRPGAPRRRGDPDDRRRVARRVRTRPPDPPALAAAAGEAWGLTGNGERGSMSAAMTPDPGSRGPMARRRPSGIDAPSAARFPPAGDPPVRSRGCTCESIRTPRTRSRRR